MLKRLDRLFTQAVRVQTIKEFPIADTKISLRRRMEIYGYQGERLDVTIEVKSDQSQILQRNLGAPPILAYLLRSIGSWRRAAGKDVRRSQVGTALVIPI